MTTMIFNGAIDAMSQMGELSHRTIDAVRSFTERNSGISRAEAEFLFLMDRFGQIGSEAFVTSAVRAIRDHLLLTSQPQNKVAEADVDWLLGMVGDRPTAFGRAVVFAVVRACDRAPERLSELAMRAHVGRCLLV